MNETGHIPVLPRAVLDALDPKPGQSVLDATLGRGGHAALILPRIANGGRYIGLDLDPANAAFSQQRLAPLAEQHGVVLEVIRSNFAAAPAALGGERVDLLLADLGFASNQMDDPARGLAFSQEGPLDMRLDPDAPDSAADLVNSLPEQELADLIYGLGEERLSRRIARKIVEQRRRSPIQTTVELARIVRQAYGPRAGRSRIDPATRTFMALRIAVNGELDALDQLLADLPALLAPSGRVGIISFHSLEDRRVKRAFLEMEQEGGFERLTRKPITAEPDEAAANPRSRSAKLRVARRLP